MRTGFIVLALLFAFAAATLWDELSDSITLAASKRTNTLHARVLADSKSFDGCTACLDLCESVIDDKGRARCEWGCPCDHSMSSENDFVQALAESDADDYDLFGDVHQALQPWERECLLCFKPCKNSRDFMRCVGERDCTASCLPLIGRELPEDEEKTLDSLTD